LPAAGSVARILTGLLPTSKGTVASYPWDVAMGPNGAVAIADLDNNRIRMLKPLAETSVVFAPLADAVNAASHLAGPVAPGMLLLLRNTGLVPSEVPETQVLFGTVPAQIVSANADGILVLAPLEIASMANTQIGVTFNGTLVAAIPIEVADSAPALLADSSGQAAVANQDGTLNSSSHPAVRGSVISLYGTGLGISPAQVSVTIGGYPADVLYAGPVTVLPGLFQVNARVPAGYLGGGDLSVVLSVGAASTQS
jgi:uncharacterized protein (TIGR03437 family)